MNFISICSHKAVVSIKDKDTKLLNAGLNLLATEVMKEPTVQINYSDAQKKLRKIRDLERKLSIISKWTAKKDSKHEIIS